MSELDSIFQEDWSPEHRSGVVAIIGRPNAGKSTLMNAILQQKIAIVSPKPQTTRGRQLGIYSTEKVQIIFVDTPGVHQAHNKLGEFMAEVVERAVRDADVVLWLVDASLPPYAEDKALAERLQSVAQYKPVILALNKQDILAQDKSALAQHEALATGMRVIRLSALQAQGVDALLSILSELVPLGPRYYPLDQVSDANMRLIAAEVIREKIILNTEKEIPYSVAVEVTGFSETPERSTIEAMIYVERDSQKGIIIGKGGQMIKTIGTQARLELVEMLETPVHLDLNVKVLKDWRSNEDLLKRVGYRLPKEDED